MRACIAVIAWALASSSLASAQTASEKTPSLFTIGDALLAGTFAIATYGIRPLDEEFARRLQDSTTQSNRNLHRVSVFVRTTAAPGAYYIGTGIYLAGRIAKDERLQSLGLHGTEGLVVGELGAQVLKRLIGRQRPSVKPRDSYNYKFLRGFQDDSYRSFPSGHSTAAFAAAAAVTSETAAWFPNARYFIAPVMFAGATATAVSRMYDNRHWASDVIAGAALGTFAGLKVVRFHRLHPETGIDQFFITGRVTRHDDGSRAIQWGVVPASLMRR